jgi:hypothetical protein
VGNRLAELSQALKDHVSELYSTLDTGSTGRNIRHDANSIKRAMLNSYPMLSKAPQHVTADDMLSSGFGAMPLSVKGINTLTRLPETEFSKAHAIAQRNAAKPIEQGGLGLHPENTATDRAKAMGFNVESPAYHQSDADILKFQNKYLGRNTKGNAVSKELEDTAKLGHWFSGQPTLTNFGGIHYQTLLRAEDPMELSSTGLLVSKLEDEGLKSVKNEMRDSGNGSLLINRDAETKAPSFVISDPKNIRSRFAAFDPSKKNSANILASLIAGTAIAKNNKKEGD